MNFVILDLEWNTAFSARRERFINEIIEFGAVKLDENLKEIGTFQQLVKSQVAKELTGKVKELTRLTKEQLNSEGVPFSRALRLFKHWVGSDCVLLTWSDTDLHVLLDNCRCFTVYQTIPFLSSYCDLQYYVQNRLHTASKQQLGLKAAAELLGAKIDGVDLHRALDDSRLSAAVLRKCYEAEGFQGFVRDALAKEFYERLEFKNYIISELDSPYIEQRELQFVCEQCGRPAKRSTPWAFHNKAFRAAFECRRCGVKFRGRVQFKKTYDSVVVKRVVQPEPTEEKLTVGQKEEEK